MEKKKSGRDHSCQPAGSWPHPPIILSLSPVTSSETGTAHGVGWEGQEAPSKWWWAGHSPLGVTVEPLVSTAPVAWRATLSLPGARWSMSGWVSIVHILPGVPFVFLFALPHR
jgi:hypothetical protein